LSAKEKNILKKRRVYQVAKEFHVSNEALIDFFHGNHYKCRNHMAPVTEEMYQAAVQEFGQKDIEVIRDSDIRRKLQEKKQEEEARREAIRHEIDEILERSKGDTFETVKVAPRPVAVEKESKEVVKPAEKKEAEDKKKVKEQKIAPKEKKVKEKAAAAKEKPPEEKKKTIKAGVKEPEVSETTVKTVKEGVKTEKEKPKRHLRRRPVSEKKGEEPKPVKKEEKAEKDKKKRRKRKKIEPGTEKLDEKGRILTRKKKKRKKRKPAIQIDEKEIEAAIKETMAKMEEPAKRKKRKKEKLADEAVVEEEGNVIRTTEFVSVSELAALMDVDASEVIKACMGLGLLVSINQRLDRDTILVVADEFGYDVKFLTEYGEERAEDRVQEEEDPALLEPRPPVVTIMGHVDHGKTSLLDYIRESNIIAGESGGITQHIGAYEVQKDDKLITFLDTPGHEAFTAMRARGAQITDIVVLVVAADDNVMPQTLEAINHSRAAAVPIVVAINKIDKQNANIDHIKQQLAENGVLVEDWGGKVQCSHVSAKTGEGIERLLETILLEAEILELKANPNSDAKGVVVEARKDRGKGIVGTVLIQRGTLRVGDAFVAGQFNGRVRAMLNERGQPIEDAPPSTPAQVLGFTGMPQAGDVLAVVESEQEAREIGFKRQQLKREQSFRQIRRITLDQISQQIAEGTVKELSMILKADVDGSLEALSDSLMKLATEDVAVRIIHKGVGAITESDVLLAEASEAVVIGFHVVPNNQARQMAQRENVDIRIYKVIYDVVNDVKMALSGLLEPEIKEEVVGTVEIREVFKASRIGMIAGCYVQSGRILRNDHVRLIRDGKVVYDGKVDSLKRFKDDVKEVAAGYECGVILDNFKDIKTGDILEVYTIVETARTL
jgi:translation initiation factor IF-2